MKPAISQFNDLVENLKKTKARNFTELEIMDYIKPYLVDLIKNSSSWLEDKYYKVDQEAGFNGFKIYEEPDHACAIYVTTWLPSRGAPPHNHGTWALIGGLLGEETNTFWRRLDDYSKEGYAEIQKINEVVCKPGDILMLDSNSIHSVINQASHISISIQIYGKHPHYTNRVQFNIETNETTPFYGKEASVIED